MLSGTTASTLMVRWVVTNEEMVPLVVAAERSGQSVIRLGRWCATGKLRCERDETGWLIPVSELPRIGTVAREHATAVEDSRVTALAVPVPAAPPDLADLVALRLGLASGKVTVTALALDGVEYVVAVWAGASAGSGGLPALVDLAEALDGELLDGEIQKD
jgi:hypothetical protein